MTPTAYTLFSSNYSAYSAQTNGAYVYSVQGGNVYAGTGGNFGYGQYSSPQADMDRTQLYIYQAQAGATPPATAGDYFYVAIKPPGSAATSTFAPLDISQSTTMLIQMGNTYTSSNNNNLPGGNVKVFTVDINNDTSAAGDGSQETADCSYDQTLAAIGIGANSALGVLNYKIPLSSFTTCAKGDIATLQASGVINVAIKVTGDKNPGIVANEFDTIAIGYIGFTK